MNGIGAGLAGMQASMQMMDRAAGALASSTSPQVVGSAMQALQQARVQAEASAAAFRASADLAQRLVDILV